MLKAVAAGFKRMAPRAHRLDTRAQVLTARNGALYDERVARHEERERFETVLRFSAAHMWVRVDREWAQIGLSDFGQEELGEIVAVELPDIGDRLERGGPFAELESVRTVQELLAPVTGTVTAVNEELEDHPELLNEDPYREGWVIEVSLAEESELDALMPAEEYEASLASEEV
jgi:glycine cleavage system H protein